MGHLARMQTFPTTAISTQRQKPLKLVPTAKITSQQQPVTKGVFKTPILLEKVMKLMIGAAHCWLLFLFYWYILIVLRVLAAFSRNEKAHPNFVSGPFNNRQNLSFFVNTANCQPLQALVFILFSSLASCVVVYVLGWFPLIVFDTKKRMQSQCRLEWGFLAGRKNDARWRSFGI